MNWFNTICIHLLILNTVLGQNLLPNPSFEEKTSCPYYYGQFNRVKSWNKIVNHPGTPDYLNRCAAASDGVSVPGNAFGFEEPHTGDAYIGFGLFDFRNTEFREYIETRLLQPLDSGTVYKVSLHYSLADEAMWSSSDLGIYFSDSQTAGNNNWDPLNIIPQLTANQLIDNKVGWRTLNLQYTASGSESYFLVGNFVRDAELTKKPSPNGTDNGCYVFFDDISVTKCGKVDLGPDVSLCEGDSLQINVSTDNATYLWQDSSTLEYFTITKPGIYWVTINLECGNLTDTVIVSFESPPSVELGNDFSLCPGDQETIIIQDANSSFQWHDGTTNDSMLVDQPGLYWVEVNNECGTDADSITITYVHVPQIELGPDATLCLGDTLILEGDIINSDSLSWQDGSNQPTFSTIESGLFILTVFNRCGSDADTILVSFVTPPPQFNLGNDSMICNGESISLSVPVFEGEITWQDSSHEFQFIVNSGDTYFAEARNLCGSSSDTVNIEIDNRVISPPSTPDTTICLGENIVLDCSQEFDANYLWEDGTSLSSRTINSPGIYRVNISTECVEQEFEFQIQQDKKCFTDDKLFIPNVFSPNGDGINDFFEVYNSSEIELSAVSFSVFDRWGSLIFFSKSLPIIWDGGNKSSVVVPGVYSFVLTFSNDTNDQTETIHGDITILK